MSNKMKGWKSTTESKPETIGYYLTAITSPEDFLVSIKFWTGEGWVAPEEFDKRCVQEVDIGSLSSARTRTFSVIHSVEYYKKIKMPKGIGTIRMSCKL